MTESQVVFNGTSYDNPLLYAEDVRRTLRTSDKGKKDETREIELSHYEYDAMGVYLFRDILSFNKRGLILLDDLKLKGGERDLALKILGDLGIGF